MSNALLAWLGKADIRVSQGASAGLGPIAQAIEARRFEHVVMLDDHAVDDGDRYVAWLKKRADVTVHRRVERLSSPTNYTEIYRAASSAAAWSLEHFGKKVELAFHLSSGTPAMQAIWIILAKTQFPAELIEASIERGIATADVPFEIAAEFLPAAVRRTESELERIATGLRPPAPAFRDIIHRSDSMKVVIDEAAQAAAYSSPVLLQGESGTGKELIAAAIHEASPRRGKPFEIVNCGAIPSALFESEFFGHEKHAFTGADSEHLGHFERANGGTIFLDEIGELTLEMQVKLLRVLQQKTIRRVGGKGEKKVDVRVVAATNRDLLQDVAGARFREDLFYRLAVLTLYVPPLRDREGDINPLLEHFMGRFNAEAAAIPGRLQKKLSAGARNVLLRQSWPGNVREVETTVLRAFIWSRGPTIEGAEVERSLLRRPDSRHDRVLGRALGDGFALDELLAEVAQHYIARALEAASNNKTKAAELVGFKSYQRLTDWMNKYKVSQ